MRAPPVASGFGPLSFVCVGETWLGSDARAAFMALRRLGHSATIIDEAKFVPVAWRTIPCRILRRLLKPLFIREQTMATIQALKQYRPDCLFVFKGNSVHPDVLRFCESRSIPAVNYYPDVSFLSHGPYIPRCLPLYDHVFTAKSFGIADMKEKLGVTNSSLLEPGYDPELHRPVRLSPGDLALYGCDVAFIGTWSPKKEAILGHVRAALADVKIRIWGCQWDKSRAANLSDCIMGNEVVGDGYAKAICGASIVLGLLSEARTGATSGDLITARTFQIPACGAFMLHERNPEALRYFEEAREAAFFEAADELVQKIRHYLSSPIERERIASGGLKRSQDGGYSVDNRMRLVLTWLAERGFKAFPLPK
jgi:spore maturation protein CgeB